MNVFGTSIADRRGFCSGRLSLSLDARSPLRPVPTKFTSIRCRNSPSTKLSLPTSDSSFLGQYLRALRRFSFGTASVHSSPKAAVSIQTQTRPPPKAGLRVGPPKSGRASPERFVRRSRTPSVSPPRGFFVRNKLVVVNRPKSRARNLLCPDSGSVVMRITQMGSPLPWVPLRVPARLPTDAALQELHQKDEPSPIAARNAHLKSGHEPPISEEDLSCSSSLNVSKIRVGRSPPQNVCRITQKPAAGLIRFRNSNKPGLFRGRPFGQTAMAHVAPPRVIITDRRLARRMHVGT